MYKFGNCKIKVSRWRFNIEEVRDEEVNNKPSNTNWNLNKDNLNLNWKNPSRKVLDNTV